MQIEIAPSSMTTPLAINHAVSSHHSDPTSTVVFAANPNSLSSTPATKLPSLFEMLLSDQLDSANQSPAAEQPPETESTGSTLAAQKSHTSSSHSSQSDAGTATSGVLTSPYTQVISQSAYFTSAATKGNVASSTSSVASAAPQTQPTTTTSSGHLTPTSTIVAGGKQAVSESSTTENQTSVAASSTSSFAAAEAESTPNTDAANLAAAETSTATVAANDLTAGSHTASVTTANLVQSQLASTVPLRQFSPSKFDTVFKPTISSTSAISADVSTRSKQVETDDAVEATRMSTTHQDFDVTASNFAAVNESAIPVTTAAQTTSTPLTSISDDLSHAITQSLGDESACGPTSVRIRLDRPDLGTVHLHLSVSDQVVSVRITTDNSAAQQLVQSQIDQLRQSLTNNGIACGQFQVGCDASNNSAADNAGNRRSNDSAAGTSGNSTSRWTRPQILQLPAARSSRLLNYVA